MGYSKMYKSIVSSLKYQFTTIKGISGLISASITGIGIYSLGVGRIRDGLLWLVVSELMLLRLELLDFIEKQAKYAIRGAEIQNVVASNTKNTTKNTTNT